jgi:hypothetical protein
MNLVLSGVAKPSIRATIAAQRSRLDRTSVTGGYDGRRLLRYQLSGSGCSREQALFNNSVNTPVTVDNLGDAKIDPD